MAPFLRCAAKKSPSSLRLLAGRYVYRGTKVFKLLLRSLLFTSLVGLIGCASSLTTEEFKDKWLASQTHSSVSWWYAGENEESVYFIENWPTNESKYKVPKARIKLIGIEPFPYIGPNIPVNLKLKNVQFEP